MTELCNFNAETREMNYYIVSPNAWNDGNCAEYLRYMKRRHVVFMGWDVDHKSGQIFANLQIGDRVIVAQGANWQKRSYFAGIVDSRPSEDRESGYQFTQYCELRSFVELEEDELPFTTECTCGSRKNPGPIHSLHPDWNSADAKIVRRLEKLIKQYEYCYSLREIANWSINKHVAIPALQRGLVWAPLQVEMLWDSIFRGFPVGSFVVTKSMDNASQSTESATTETSYFLLDGQQRYNAISLGFQPVSHDSKAVLWIDLLPPKNNNSTRKHWFKVTTSSHPWGFGNDDACSLLGWPTYRAALKSFTGRQDIDNIKLKDISLDTTWPYRSDCPVRMCEIMNIFRNVISHLQPGHADNVSQLFQEKVMDLLTTSVFYKKTWKDTEENRSAIKDNISKLYSNLEKLEDFRITANVLQNNTIEDEEEITNEVTNLENLFTRLNTLGTPISPYDLRYSAIKAYWGTIKESNDEIASRIMPAAHLAVLAFRLAMTIDKIETDAGSIPKLANVPTVSQIRNFGKDRQCRVSQIVANLYHNNGACLKEIIDSIETTLSVAKTDVPDGINGLPPVLRTNIIYDSQDIYLLLAVMAYKGIQIKGALGLLLWIHWFNIGSKKDICDFLLGCYINGEDKSPRYLLDSLISKGWILSPVKYDTFESILPQSPNEFTPDWDFNIFRNDQEKYPWMSLFDRLIWNRQLMVFAERKYFNLTFDYDPALTNFNSGHNKPWDVDHIVPQAWMKRQGKQYGEWKSVCNQWLWTIGNLAAIPFSINRSKNDSAEWEAYCTHSEELFFDKSILVLAENNLTYEREKAYLFAKTCLNRIIRIYQDLLKQIPECDTSNHITH